MIIYPDTKDRGTIRCGVCSNLIEEFTRIYQPFEYYGIVCEDCKNRFSTKDLELMVQMFAAFGGHFGQYEEDTKEKVTIGRLIGSYMKSLDSSGESIDIGVLQSKLTHKAMLMGLTPSEFQKKLQNLIK